MKEQLLALADEILQSGCFEWSGRRRSVVARAEKAEADLEREQGVREDAQRQLREARTELARLREAVHRLETEWRFKDYTPFADELAALAKEE